MFQPAGVVVVFADVHPVGKGNRRVDLHVVIRLVVAVASSAFALPELHLRERVVSGQFTDVICNTVLVKILEFLAAHLVVQDKQHTGIDNRLTAHGVLVVFKRDVDVGKYL